MKGQSAFEFMIIFAILMVALLSVLVAVYSNIADITYSKIEIASIDFVEEIRNKINTVYLEGNGFSLIVDLPDRFYVTVTEETRGYDYEFLIDGETLILNVVEFNSFSRNLLTENITGTLSPGSNTIKNVNGEIVIS